MVGKGNQYIERVAMMILAALLVLGAALRHAASVDARYRDKQALALLEAKTVLLEKEIEDLKQRVLKLGDRGLSRPCDIWDTASPNRCPAWEPEKEDLDGSNECRSYAPQMDLCMRQFSQRTRGVWGAHLVALLPEAGAFLPEARQCSP